MGNTFVNYEGSSTSSEKIVREPRPTLYVAHQPGVQVKTEIWQTRCTGTASRSSSGSSSRRSWVVSSPHCCRAMTRARRDCCQDAGEVDRRRPSAISVECLHYATRTRTPSSETAAHCHPPVTQHHLIISSHIAFHFLALEPRNFADSLTSPGLRRLVRTNHCKNSFISSGCATFSDLGICMYTCLI